MGVNTADKKPQIVKDPETGKQRVRMVPVDKEVVKTEKKLTPAELKKREKVAKSIERDNPDMPMDKKMAIATSVAKKTAEDNVSELKKSTLANYITKASDDRTKNAYDVGKTGKINYKGLKRRQGINRALNKLTKEDNVAEVLDTHDKAMNYKQRAKYSRDRASNSQAAHSLRGTDPSKDQDTERKRTRGLKSYDKLVTRKTFKALRGKK